MKIKLLLLLSLLFFVEIGFSQNYLTYSSYSHSLNLNSGQEGYVDLVIRCSGNKVNDPVIANAELSCGNNDGILSTAYSDGHSLTPGKSTTLRYRFKKNVAEDTQIVYKFSTNGSCTQDESEMIKITVYYKKSTSTTPPEIPPHLIYINNWPNTTATINEGDIAPTITSSGPGNYAFKWYKIVNEVQEEIPGATNYYYSPGRLYETTQYVRSIIAGTNMGQSYRVTITVNPAPALLNNTIAINGSLIQGSTPTGGTGVYTYRWLIYAVEGEIPGISPITTKDYTIPEYLYDFVDMNNVYIERQVISGAKISTSNYVQVTRPQQTQNKIITPSGQKSTGSSARMAATSTVETASSDFTVYPNPTTEVVNFATNFSTNKEIEIVVYSESIRNEKSVFKGTVTPNQVVNWNIPSDYPKGIYFYKILSGSKEVKAGKIIVQ